MLLAVMENKAMLTVMEAVPHGYCNQKMSLDHDQNLSFLITTPRSHTVHVQLVPLPGRLVDKDAKLGVYTFYHMIQLLDAEVYGGSI